MKCWGSSETRFGQVPGQSEPSSRGKRPFKVCAVSEVGKIGGRRKIKCRESSETRFGKVSRRSEPSSRGKRPFENAEPYPTRPWRTRIRYPSQTPYPSLSSGLHFKNEQSGLQSPKIPRSLVDAILCGVGWRVGGENTGLHPQGVVGSLRRGF